MLQWRPAQAPAAGAVPDCPLHAPVATGTGAGTGVTRHGAHRVARPQNLMLPIIPAMFVVSWWIVGAIVDEAR